MSKPSTWAIADDLSRIVETEDGFGRFPTKLAALEHQITLLQCDRARIAEQLAEGKRRRRRELKKQ